MSVLLPTGQFTPSVVFAFAQWAGFVDSCSACDPASAAAASAATTAVPAGLLPPNPAPHTHSCSSQLFHHHFSIDQRLRPLLLAYRFSNLCQLVHKYRKQHFLFTVAD